MNHLLNQYQSFLKGTSRNSYGSELRRSSEPSVIARLRTPRKVRNLTPSTIRNYLSDTRHFLKWLSKAIQEPTIKPRHITPAVIKSYASELDSELRRSSEPLYASSEPRLRSELKDVSLSTINRRLSSLRRFGHFLTATGLLDNDPTANLNNLNPSIKNTTIGQIIKHYQNYLKDEELSNSTIKNYLSDLKSYLLWAQNNNHLTNRQLNQRQT